MGTSEAERLRLRDTEVLGLRLTSRWRIKGVEMDRKNKKRESFGYLQKLETFRSFVLVTQFSSSCCCCCSSSSSLLCLIVVSSSFAVALLLHHTPLTRRITRRLIRSSVLGRGSVRRRGSSAAVSRGSKVSSADASSDA